ncbi:hypothetical protein [Pseudanabaena sp. 'Roaring Creek']|uniref:hypothetical protein n=1 Tax=Pseudanabaena sp. 'Roaring Creek' TaxID=1681830 RepID=UPI0012E1E024|nr:hypothetical protein [Pseudanabaena sp. 'Roaring Creek']
MPCLYDSGISKAAKAAKIHAPVQPSKLMSVNLSPNFIQRGSIVVDIKFAYWVPNVSGGLVISKIPQRTDWSSDYEASCTIPTIYPPLGVM